MIDDKLTQQRREWIARQKARLDQRKKEFEAQYPMVCPHVNLHRLDWLEVEAFRIEMHEWELRNLMSAQGEQ